MAYLNLRETISVSIMSVINISTAHASVLVIIVMAVIILFIVSSFPLQKSSYDTYHRNDLFVVKYLFFIARKQGIGIPCVLKCDYLKGKVKGGSHVNYDATRSFSSTETSPHKSHMQMYNMYNLERIRSLRVPCS